MYHIIPALITGNQQKVTWKKNPKYLNTKTLQSKTMNQRSCLKRKLKIIGTIQTHCVFLVVLAPQKLRQEDHLRLRA